MRPLFLECRLAVTVIPTYTISLLCPMLGFGTILLPRCFEIGSSLPPQHLTSCCPVEGWGMVFCHFNPFLLGPLYPPPRQTINAFPLLLPNCPHWAVQISDQLPALLGKERRGALPGIFAPPIPLGRQPGRLGAS